MQLLLVFGVCVVCVQCVPIGEMDVRNARGCGVEASSSAIHRDPWLVHLEYFRDGYRHTRCAATLVGSRHAVTAAHCVSTSLYSLVARLGEYDLKTEVDIENGIVADPVVRINIARVIVHGDYDGSADDIAVLVLEEDAPYTNFIRPICLPSGTVDESAVFRAAGWGKLPATHVYSHVKKTIPLPYWPTRACQQVYKNLPARAICAGGGEGVDTCRGDSGGPLALRRHTSELWGVTSSGNVNCGTRGSPGIYTSVRDHLEWLGGALARTS